MTQPTLPIHAVLPDLLQKLEQFDDVILEAPPGAGKTTVVPLAILNHEALGDKKILMLEPRRLAARNAALRMADMLGEKVGETVGYRIRLETKVSSKTRIEVITEGVLARLIHEDPSLDDYAVVIFDEFHERSLHADLGLSLSLHGRTLFSDLREQPLKLLVMSATLNGEQLKRILPQAELVQSEGRAYPVDIVYGAAYSYSQDTVSRVVDAIIDSYQRNEGSQLVFLPGQGEIQRTQTLLQERLKTDVANGTVAICPLFGALNAKEQRLAIEPSKAGQTKIVLATNIAETSLTIDGIKVVIDSGLGRCAVFDLASGLSKLTTNRISKASATQRAGRAGRTAAGICYRLWSKEQHFDLREYDQPEILSADLAPVLLQLMQMGVNDYQELDWLDCPKPAAFDQAYDLLVRLNAVEKSESGQWVMTKHGEQMASLPVHPRLAAILVYGAFWQQSRLACDLVALLSERDILIDERDVSADLHLRLLALRGEYSVRKHHKARLNQIKQQARQLLSYSERLRFSEPCFTPSQDEAQVMALLLCVGFPDRLAKKRRECSYRLSNGRSAQLNPSDSLKHSDYLIAANVAARQNQATDTIYLAVSADSDFIESHLTEYVTEHIEVDWDASTGRFLAEVQQRMGSVVLSAKPLDFTSAKNQQLKKRALQNVMASKKWQLFDRNDAYQQWLGRVKLIVDYKLLDIADVSEERLFDLLMEALDGELSNINKLEDFKRFDVVALIQPLLHWQLATVLSQQVPERFTLPNGKRAKIDYSVSPPVVAAKLQWFFGCGETPTVCEGKQKLLVHLLSPAQRPLQVTQDLAGFWSGSYHAVKKDMKGRYPKHAWPDNPEQYITD